MVSTTIQQETPLHVETQSVHSSAMEVTVILPLNSDFMNENYDVGCLKIWDMVQITMANADKGFKM